MTVSGVVSLGRRLRGRSCSTLAAKVVGRGRGRASRSRRSSAARRRRACGSTAARSSRSRRPTSAGIGVRVVQRRPPGLRLRRHARRRRSSPRCWPRPATTPRFAEPDDVGRPGRARRRGAARPSTCGATAWPACPPTARSSWRSSSSGPSGPATPASPACASRQCGDGSGVGAVVTSTGIARGRALDRAATCRCRPWPTDGDETKTGDGVVGRARARRPRPRRGRRRGRRPRHAPARRRASPPAARSPSCSSPGWPPRCSGIVAGTLTGEPVLKGRSPFADRVGEPIASPLLTLVDDPTDPRSLGADSHDGEGLATPPQPADRRRRAAGLPPQLDHRPARRRAVDRLGRARLPLDARGRGPGPGHGAGRRARSTS